MDTPPGPADRASGQKAVATDGAPGGIPLPTDLTMVHIDQAGSVHAQRVLVPGGRPTRTRDRAILTLAAPELGFARNPTHAGTPEKLIDGY